MPRALVECHPDVAPSALLADLVPPPQFAHVTFDSFVPDPAEPTQQAAVAAMRVFAERVCAPRAKPRRFRRAAPPEGRPGLYLDGGFGVGKTHLLAALWHVAPEPKTYGTFVEYTNVVGALGFRSTVESLRSQRLVCIDEFELDDPGDTVLMSTLLGALVDNGVFLAATSNTLPDRLGEERFAADDFLREIQGLAAHFDVIRIDGPDYRHRETHTAPQPFTDADLVLIAEREPGASVDTWADLQAHLTTVHPSAYGHLLDDLTVCCLAHVRPLTDQAQALRTVVFIDRLYDRDIPLAASGVPIDQMFTPDMLRGGYRKKYFRAISRAMSLARTAQDLLR